jgi:hypothetical protein
MKMLHSAFSDAPVILVALFSTLGNGFLIRNSDFIRFVLFLSKLTFSSSIELTSQCLQFVCKVTSMVILSSIWHVIDLGFLASFQS